MKKLVPVLGFAAFCSSATAHAHFNLVAPPPNTTTTDGGMGSPPCGVGTASGVVTSAQGGHTLTIKVDEYVAHTGFYRIALAMNSPSELPLDPVVKDAMNNILPPSGKPAGNSAVAACSDSPVFPVLEDHVFQHRANGEQMFQVDITLPNINCTKCTLQVLEFMAGHGFNPPTPPDTGAGGGYFYRHCADLKITADTSLPLTSTGGASATPAAPVMYCDGTGTGGASSSAGGATASNGGASSSAAGASASNGGASASSGASAAGGSGMPATGGGVSAAGGAPSGASGSTGGIGVTGSGGASASAAPDNGGCSCSLANNTAPFKPLATLSFGLLALGLRRRARRAPKSER